MYSAEIGYENWIKLLGCVVTRIMVVCTVMDLKVR
jgi:hypothetical protein